MPLPDFLLPQRMRRVAVIAPTEILRDVLVRVADAGVVDFDSVASIERASTAAAGIRLQRLGAPAVGPPMLTLQTPDLDELVRSGRSDLLAGEAELERYLAGAVRRDGMAAWVGWCATDGLGLLGRQVAEASGSVIELPNPPGIDPPTQLPEGTTVHRSFVPLVNTYGTVPYADIDPTVLAGVAYVVMFGMMFGDAGHGLVLLAVAGLLRIGRPRWLARLRSAWLFVAGAGFTSILFGLLYGDFFGPTGLVPVLWLTPLDQPLTLLAAAIGVGAVLLAAAYALAIVNRWREGGPRLAVYASGGIAGAAVFLGLGALAGGLYLHIGSLTVTGGLVAAVGALLAAAGFYAAAGGGGSGGAQAAVELFDTVIRIGSNLLSFARLAAFGLTHATLGALVWQGTEGLSGHGWWGLCLGGLVFVAGNALTFALEGFVAAIQAMRLTFYELFSRVFQSEGRPFRPWHISIRPIERHLSEEAS